MLKKLVCLPKILFLFFSILFGVTTISNAVTIDVPGFSVVNEFALPDGIPIPLGDVVFSADGNTLYISGSSFPSEVWSVSVTRDPVSGRVTELPKIDPETGLPVPAKLIFSVDFIDGSLEFHNGTLFFRTFDPNDVFAGAVGERTSGGTIEIFSAEGSADSGGLAFMPLEFSENPNIDLGDLLVGDWSGEINSYSLKDNEDGTFTPESPVLYTMIPTPPFAIMGDLHFIPSGSFANDLMFTNWWGGTIGIIDIDPDTGLPGGSSPPSITPFASGLGKGPWGLEFDPITNDLFVSNSGGTPLNGIIQISGFPAPLSISMDIKPRRCPNKLKINDDDCSSDDDSSDDNRRNRRKLKVAILGTETFDVRTIDVGTIKLNGVAPFKPSKAKFKDVAQPSELEPCGCEDYGPDYYADLVLKFDGQDIIDTLVGVQDGDEIPLFLTAMLKDGITPIVGWDCVLIKTKKHGHHHNHRRHKDDDSCSSDDDISDDGKKKGKK